MIFMDPLADLNVSDLSFDDEKILNRKKQGLEREKVNKIPSLGHMEVWVSIRLMTDLWRNWVKITPTNKN